MTKRNSDKTILIIEDDLDIQAFVARLLELEGYRVLAAETAEEGLRLLKENQVALLLLDLRLPGDSGWVVLGEIKSQPALSAIPVIIVTASAGDPKRQQALGMGAVDYLIKPLGAAALKKAVSRALRRKR